jgi:hypothetical protein
MDVVPLELHQSVDVSPHRNGLSQRKTKLFKGKFRKVII